MAFVERIVPDETPPGPVAIHTKRYLFALPYCAGKRALDAACGVGYGTAILAEQASEVVGLDLSDDAIAYARERYALPNVEFRVADLVHPGLEAETFDVVVSFETIEHLPDREEYLGQVARALRPGGTFIVSTPRADVTTEAPENPFHFVEYSRADFQALLERYFAEIEVYGQRRLRTRRHRVIQRLDVLGLRRLAFLRPVGKLATGTEPMWDVTAEAIAIDQERLDEATEVVAVCRRPIRP